MEVERVWMQTDSSEEQSQEEAATEDERHENLAGDTACSDKC